MSITDVRPEPPAEPASAWDPGVSLRGRDHFRPDIEGLRAVAILGVLAFHAGVPFIPGGFVGVDVFFVISGFLITGLLLREHESSRRIDLLMFYARRARRLLPAALVVIALTVAASGFLLSPLTFRDVAGDGAAAALYVSNYRFALTATDYFAEGAGPSPLLHFWSLGVEEQFYLFWPLLMIVGLRVLGRRRIPLLIAGVAIASFAASVVITAIEPAWAFYSLPTRAWQIALGALLAAWFATWSVRLPLPFAAALGPVGLLLILLATVVIDATSAYPGWWAVLPALGAAMLIVAGERPTTLASRALASAVPRWFGRISYSLYLWHWPVLVIVPLVLENDALWLKLVLAAVTVGIAALSTRFIENPFRPRSPGRQLPSRRTVFAAVFSSLAVASLALASSMVVARPSGNRPVAHLPDFDRVTSVRPSRLKPVLSGPVPRDLVPSLFDAREDLGALEADDCQTGGRDLPFRECVYGVSSSRTTVVLVGDSHASMWFAAAERVARERGWRLVPVVKLGCAAIAFTVWDTSLKRPYDECDAWRSQTLDYIASQHPAITLLAVSRLYQIADDSGNPIKGDARFAAYRAAFAKTFGQLQQVSDRVVLIGEAPGVPVDPVECLLREKTLQACTPDRSAAVDRSYQQLEKEATEEAGVEYVSSVELLCRKAACPLVLGDFLVYRSSYHLTATITAALAPQLLWALDHPS